MSGWIGVDLDGTLAEYTSQIGEPIGKPILPMVNRVRDWLIQDVEVRIVTARVSCPDESVNAEQKKLIQDWLESIKLPRLDVVCSKDYGMIELWDDRAVCVERNTGAVLGRNRD